MHKINYMSGNWLVLKLNNSDIRKNLCRFKGTVYDLGCGTRPYEMDILSVAEKYIGVDWHKSIHHQKADIFADLNTDLPITDNAADTVVSFQVLEHLYEPQKMLNEAFRILKPGGVLYLSVPFQWWIHEAPYDYYRYTRYGLEYMLAKSGFEDIEIIEATGFWSMWLLKLNYQIMRRVNGKGLLKLIAGKAMLPVLLINQFLAPMLDRVMPDTTETAGYYVNAVKPVKEGR